MRRGSFVVGAGLGLALAASLPPRGGRPFANERVGGEPASERPVLAVGSKNFVESTVLAEILAQVLEARAGAVVDRRFDLGGTLLCFDALRTNELSVYPEYTGTGLVAILGEAPPRQPLEAFLRARRGFAERYGLEWLDPFGFENTYALALRSEDAARLGLRTLSDLARVSSGLRLGASAEFLRRPDGLAALESTYGLHFADVRGLSHELAYRALEERQIDVLDAYTTDPELARARARVLEDDRRAFPPYDAAPLARADVLETLAPRALGAPEPRRVGSTPRPLAD